MIKLVKPKIPYKPECGDLNWGQNDINEWLTSLKNILPVGAQTIPGKKRLTASAIWEHPWESLRNLGVDAEQLNLRYECGVTGLEFWVVVPVAIWTDDVRRYRHKPYTDSSFDYAFDLDWHEKMMPSYQDLNHIPNINKIMLGTGYTGFCRPSDGSHQIIGLFAPLDNGDFLQVHTWEWYNK
jgi:hypothetical protein